MAQYTSVPAGVDRELVARLHATRGPAYTLRIDGQIAACYGMAVLWPGLGEVWAIVTPLGRQHPVILTRSVLRRMHEAERGVRRLQADVQADSEPAVRWIELLGFHRESAMPRFGPRGETFYRYVKFVNSNG